MTTPEPVAANKAIPPPLERGDTVTFAPETLARLASAPPAAAAATTGNVNVKAATTPTQLFSPAGSGADLNIAKYLPASSPQVTRLIKYLMSLGAPKPTIFDQIITVPGGLSYPLDELNFDDGKGHSKMIDASLAYAFPNVAANDLASAGIIILKQPLFNVPVPSVNGAPGQPAAATPPAKSSSPIGPEIPGTGHFEVEPYWVFPLGTPWTDLATGRRFVLDGAINPFGQEQWWKPTVPLSN